MRIRLTLYIKKSENGTLLPCNYQYPLSSVIYKILNEGNSEFAAWLHDKGYLTEELKSFKMFTFSNLLIPKLKIFEDRLNILSDEIQLIISFYPIEAIEAFVMGLFKDRRFILGDKRSRVSFEVIVVERLPDIEFSSAMEFQTLSPLFIEEKETESRNTKHLSPANPNFAALLHYNLLEKYRAFYQKEPDQSWTVTQVRLSSEPKAKIITIKADTPQQTKVRGFMCNLELTGEPELLKLGYYAGFGRGNAQGFGCVEINKRF